MLYCENNNNINRCKSIYYLSSYINNQFRYNKYINVLSIILLLILSNIVNGNKLYAEARDTDGVSIIRSGEDPSCISQCDSINENTIHAGATYLGDYAVNRCEEKNGNGCNDAYAKETVCKGKLYSGSLIGFSLVPVRGQFTYKYVCNTESGNSFCWKPSVYCHMVYRAYCYINNPIYLEVLVTTNHSDDTKASFTSRLKRTCNGSVGEFRSICKTRCSAYKLKMGNREINTVRDLLDSVPTTEFLKVYDPNMVNY